MKWFMIFPVLLVSTLAVTPTMALAQDNPEALLKKHRAAMERDRSAPETEMRNVIVKPSPIHGTGVFAAVDFGAGDRILKRDDSRLVTDENPLREGERPYHCDWIADGRVVYVPEPERYTNHSCDPNAVVEVVDEVRYCTARRNIRDGLNSDALRLRLETSWKLIDHVTPKSVQRHEVDVGGHIDVNTSIEMNETLKVIESQLPALAAAAGNFRKRIKQGPGALPGPPTEVKGNGRQE